MGVKNNVKEINEPGLCEDLAEFVGIMLGDGNIYSKNHSHQVRIAGHGVDDYEYLGKYVNRLIKDLFNISSSVAHTSGTNTMYLKAGGKNLILFLKSIGLHPGNKLTNGSRIPHWIYNNNTYLRACLRGLFDTDGSVYELLPHWPGLFQINFTNRNDILISQVKKGLERLGLHPSRIHNQHITSSKAKRLVITRKRDIKKFYKEIGSSNSKHLIKVGRIIAP